jgi:outer membrane protein OmpA-like peptidoglycan-associated protein
VIPVQPSYVVEVSSDHTEAGRFRHGSRLLRWRHRLANAAWEGAVVAIRERSPLLTAASMIILLAFAFAAAPARAQNYTIYFETGGCNLSANAQAVLREVVLRVRSGRRQEMIVQGFADTVGAAPANQRLSECRAKAAVRFLRAEGVEAHISVQSFGKTMMAVPTPDNTPEIRNRRVQILVQ